jgi:erythromycin esterase
MKSFFRSLLATAIIAATSLVASAQPASTPAAATDTARLVLPAHLTTPVSLQSYEGFRAAVQPLIRQMAGKKVVAMGEGTHGTAEFYKARFWLTRILVEEHGFDQLALENTYGDTYQLNQALQNGDTDFKPLMRKTLLSMWQNQEMAQVFSWMQQRNRTHRHKVTLTGIDAMFSSADAELLQKGLAATGRQDLKSLTDQLVQSSIYKDKMWYQFSDSTYKPNYKELFPIALAGYDAADKLLKALPTLKLSRQQQAVLTDAATNARMAFDTFYQAKVNKRDSSRDSVFAEMTRLLVRGKGQRIIIWAHDAHVARRGVVPGDSNGGGTGAFLERMFPGQYFVLATATAGGSFTATTQNFISPASPMAAYPLPQPKAGSWEASLAHASSPNFYFFTKQLGAQDQSRPLRLTGQTIGSEKFYADMKLSAAFDAVLFLRQTTAATPLL